MLYLCIVKREIIDIFRKMKQKAPAFIFTD